MYRFVFAIFAAPAVGLIFGFGPVGYAAEQKPGMGNNDKEFVKTASGLLEPLIDASKLGVEKASDPRVKALSQEMAKAYPDLLAGLKDAAGKAGLSVADEPDPRGANRVERLRDSGGEFDLAYLIEQDGLHEKLVAIYGMEMEAGEAKPLKAYAENGQTLLWKNFEQISHLRESLTEERTTPGR